MDTFEKKYNEALDWMRKIYPTLTGANKEDAEHYFPELKESEDERIRKEIATYLYNELHNIFQPTPRTNTYDSWLSWIEKHKEEKGQCEDRKIVEDSAKCGPGVTVSGDEWANEMTSEDEKIVSKVKSILERAYKYGDASIDGCDFNEIYAWLEKQKEKKPCDGNCDKCPCYNTGLEIGMDERKSVGWSEKDEKMREDTIKAFQLAYPYALENENPRRKNIDWLKSLRSRPKSSDNWKPSKEQMDALEKAWLECDSKETSVVLSSLMFDLQKLL